MEKSPSPTSTAATPDITPLTSFPPRGDTPGLIVFLLDNGDDSALIIGDDRGGFAFTVELADWPAAAVHLLRVHTTRPGGPR